MVLLLRIIIFMLTERNLWKKCTTDVTLVYDGEMCCLEDSCFISCDDGFYPDEYAFFVCEMVNETYVWTDGFGSQIDDFFFYNASCIGMFISIIYLPLLITTLCTKYRMYPLLMH